MEKREENRVSLSLSLRRGRSGSDPNRSGCCSCFRLQSSIRGGRDRGARGVRRVPPPQEPKKVLVRVEEDRVDDEGAGLFFEIFKFSFLSFLSFFEFFDLIDSFFSVFEFWILDFWILGFISPSALFLVGM